MRVHDLLVGMFRKVFSTSPVTELTLRHGRKAPRAHGCYTASGLPINVEGHVCKMLAVQAVPTVQRLRSGPTEPARQPFSALR
jgi:hypothetical protein